MEYTKVSANAFDTLQINAGIVVSGFDPDDGSITGSIIGVTSGGVTFNANPTYTDFGDGLDNVPGSTWQLKRITGYDPALSGTFRTVTPSLAKKLSGSGTIDSAKITPSGQLVAADFSDIWLVGDYSAVNKTDDDTGAQAGFCAVHLLNAFSSSGFQWKSSDEDKGEYSFDFHGHYSMATISLVPFELYVKGYAPVITVQPSDQAVGDGDPVVFSVEAIGGSSYQWQYSTNGTTWSNTAANNKSSKTPNYTFTSASTFDGRLYRCVVSNAHGSTTTDSAEFEYIS